jgi:sulfopyruvate decarboxylase subunit beta
LYNHDKPGENLADVKVLSPDAHRLPAHGVLLTRDSVDREPQMNYIECFRTIARHRTHELVVTSAGNSSQAWWEVTRDSEASFYLDASMSLSTMFASGLALARPEQKVWAFMGDGAFCMNPGMLMVEREMNLPNLTHFLVSNRAYGATSNAGLPNFQNNDYAATARSMGLDRIFEFGSIEEIERDFAALHSANLPGHTFVILEVEPFSDAEQRLEQPPFDGPELKYRFGRHLERQTGCDIFGYRT